MNVQFLNEITVSVQIINKYFRIKRSYIYLCQLQNDLIFKTCCPPNNSGKQKMAPVEAICLIPLSVTNIIKEKGQRDNK